MASKIDTSPVPLNGPHELLALSEALGMVEFWEHHRNCKPMSMAGCECGLWKIRGAVQMLRLREVERGAAQEK